MEGNTTDQLRRSSSQNSAASSRRINTLRERPRKRSSNTSLQNNSTPSPQENLTSFPSLSPDTDPSPIAARQNGATLLSDRRRSSQHDRETLRVNTVRKVSKPSHSLVGTLMTAPAPDDNRSALFDDTLQATAVPGNVHYMSDDDIKRMLEHSSAVSLIRQLAGDLAQRDAQMSSLRRKVEERERVLKKMLQECEVSNLDIETRLRTLERTGEEHVRDTNGTIKARNSKEVEGTHPDDPIDKRLFRAIQDDISEDFSENLSLHEDISVAVTSMLVKDTPNTDAAASTQPQEPRGWKSYVWGGTTRKSSRAPSLLSDDAAGSRNRSRASSGSQPARKALSQDLFKPPATQDSNTGKAIPNLRRLQSQDLGKATSERRQSGSVASWALKLVAGSGQASKEGDKKETLRGKDGQTRPPMNRSLSSESNNSQSKGKSGTVPRGRAKRSSLGPGGTIRANAISPESLRASHLTPSSPHGAETSSSNLGPVEMDTILPEDSRPPTLMLHHNNMGASQEYLTDRFGFIYDQRRKKRQSEAAAALRKQHRDSNVESLGNGRAVLDDSNENEPPRVSPETQSLHRPASKSGSTHSSVEEPNVQPGKRWQDFLKLATFPTELLSHTPSAAPITSVEAIEVDAVQKPHQVSVNKKGSVPAISTNPDPSPSRIISANAEFATPALSTGPMDSLTALTSQQPADPVKALLEQLTDLHDSLQRDKTVKWNEFLRKVRAEKKREGEAAHAAEGRNKGLTMPEAMLMDGEIVGVAGLGNKGKVGRAKWQEFRELVLDGIPVAYRAKIWAECSGASSLRIPGYYEDLVKNGVDDPVIASQIQMDITRTLTDNIFFRKGPGVDKLKEVLLAYSRRNTEVGYCQGMNLITASLLLIMPTTEDAFWVLASMIENILPDNYYDHSLLTSRADQVVLRSFVTELLPKLSGHLDELGIELEALTFQWFLSVFTDCLSAEALFRVWDVVLCMHDGSTFLFQIALALLKLNERSLLDCDNPASIYHYINHQMTNHAISIDGLIQASDALKKVVRRKDVEERRARAVERERDVMLQREELRRQRSLDKAQRAKQASPERGETRSRSRQITDALSQSMSHESSPMRSVSASSIPSIREEEEEEVTDGLENTTPMPLDEEALWRA